MAYGSPSGGPSRGPRPGGPGGGPDRSKNRRFKRRKVSTLTINKIKTVDYKNVSLLRTFTDDRGKIIPRRRSGATAKEQRMIAVAIKRAREIALLPFVKD
jgi:small subunit ribosomal protein S18